jgi:hypothetical protein
MDCVDLSEFVYSVPVKSSVHEAKAAALLSTYKCFGTGSRKDHKWVRRATATPLAAPERPKKFGVVLTEEGQARKEILPLMNKLTDKNRTSILSQIQNCLKPKFASIYIDIVWTISLECPNYQSLYIDVLDIMIKKGISTVQEFTLQLSRLYADYIDNKCFELEAGVCTQEYDEFCDYVKWKKRTIALIHLLTIIEQKGYLQGAIVGLTSKLIKSCEVALNDTDYDKADVLLDQILEVQGGTAMSTISAFVQWWIPQAPLMRPSTRFKFYALQDKYKWRPKSLKNLK